MSRQTRWYLTLGVILTIIVEALVTVAIIWWPKFLESLPSLKNLAAPVPMLRRQIDVMDAAGVAGYISGQHFFKVCNTLGAAAAVLFAISAVAGEVHRGTLEIWLARPVTRTRLLTERYLAGLLAIVVPVFLTSATIPALLTMVDETMSQADLFRCSVHASLFLACIYGLTFFLSSVGSNPLKIAIGMLFLCIFQFAIYMVKTITNYSLFRIVDIEKFTKICLTHRLDWRIELGMAVVAGTLFAGSLRAVHRRVP